MRRGMRSGFVSSSYIEMLMIVGVLSIAISIGLPAATAFQKKGMSTPMAFLCGLGVGIAITVGICAILVFGIMILSSRRTKRLKRKYNSWIRSWKTGR